MKKLERMDDAELWHNGFHPITPANLINSLESAKEVINYSNYDCANFNRLIEILLRYSEEHGIEVSMEQLAALNGESGKTEEEV